MTSTSPNAAKKCSSCGETLPLSAFNRATQSADGRAPVCRRCVSAARKIRQPARQKNEIRAAIKVGNIDQVRGLISSSRFSLDQMLALAAQDYNTARKHSGHDQIVDFLILKGARPHWSMLCEAVRSGSQSIVDRLIAGGAELNIFACAAVGDAARTKGLLQGDSSLARARTPQELARYQNLTPLHFCSLSGLGRESPEKEQQLLDVATLLVASGAEINATGLFYGPLVVTPLDLAAHTGGNLPLIRFLIDQGAQISSFAFANALEHRGRSVEGGFALADLLLQKGYQIETEFKDGTVLHSAANGGNAAIVRWLLEHGADVNARGRMGRTPLHLAAERNTSPRVAEILAERGADLHATDDQGLSALEIAEQHGKTAVATWLRKKLSQNPK